MRCIAIILALLLSYTIAIAQEEKEKNDRNHFVELGVGAVNYGDNGAYYGSRLDPTAEGFTVIMTGPQILLIRNNPYGLNWDNSVALSWHGAWGWKVSKLLTFEIGMAGTLTRESNLTRSFEYAGYVNPGRVPIDYQFVQVELFLTGYAYPINQSWFLSATLNRGVQSLEWIRRIVRVENNGTETVVDSAVWSGNACYYSLTIGTGWDQRLSWKFSLCGHLQWTIAPRGRGENWDGWHVDMESWRASLALRWWY